MPASELKKIAIFGQVLSKDYSFFIVRFDRKYVVANDVKR